MTPTTSGRTSKQLEDKGLISRVGPLEIDWPRSIGYFGGIGLAVAFELIAPPIALFIAAVPVLKLFKHPGQAWPLRIVADALEGAAKPVGGDTEAVVRLAADAPARQVPGKSIGRPQVARRRSLRAA
jgi:hypothetical protein